MTIIQMRNERTIFLDTKLSKQFYIDKIYSEHKINHVKVIYMKSICGKHKAQFTDVYFDYLVNTKQLIKQENEHTK